MPIKYFKEGMVTYCVYENVHVVGVVCVFSCSCVGLEHVLLLC